MDNLALFRIETDKVSLTWSKFSDKQTHSPRLILNTPGLLKITKKRTNLIFSSIWRACLPEGLSSTLEQEAGPCLFEECNYEVWVNSKADEIIEVNHHDPLIVRNLRKKENGRIHYGVINFGSQIGLSEFSVTVNGKPEFDFLVEVFPSKLDYKSDYEQMIAEVQDILTGLAIEYLRSTFKLGSESHVPKPTQLEWLYLLKNIATKLEEALQQIDHHPVRRILREPVLTRAEKIKRIDSTIRSAVRQGTGSGRFISLQNGLSVRQLLVERRARTTLDTPEHRWLATQIDRICQKLSFLRQQEAQEGINERRDRVLKELDQIECRMRRLTKYEPIASAQGDPPQGFSSLQLQGAPGYREAYQNCLILQLGLRIEGGPLRLSIKDLHLLYEYWCYIALLRIISEETGQPIPAKNIFSIRQQGLHVLLQKGRSTSVKFKTHNGRMVEVAYNRFFRKGPVLVPQQPDMMITFHDPEWPEMNLIVDAKYRIDNSQKYYEQYGSSGPPDEAINVLHRYRDAILDSKASCDLPKRTIVQAAAFFPYREKSPGAYTKSRLWMALDRIGIGAVPFLPGLAESKYLRKWLRKILQQGGWSLADKAIGSISDEQKRDWRQAASEAVLIGVLRGGEGGVPARHLEWIKEKKCYYIPIKETQRRFYIAKWIAFYLPSELRTPGAIAYRAEIREIEIKPRKEINTPWAPSRDKDEDQFVYHIDDLCELNKPIENLEAGVGKPFTSHRWTSRLALERARNLTELFLETEPEWRLYEELRASAIEFLLKPGEPKVSDPDNPSGRAWFKTQNGEIQYRGSSGFLLKTLFHEDRYFVQVSDVIKYLKSADKHADMKKSEHTERWDYNP
jgi:hypothetical protein